MKKIIFYAFIFLISAAIGVGIGSAAWWLQNWQAQKLTQMPEAQIEEEIPIFDYELEQEILPEPEEEPVIEPEPETEEEAAMATTDELPPPVEEPEAPTEAAVCSDEFDCFIESVINQEPAAATVSLTLPNPMTGEPMPVTNDLTLEQMNDGSWVYTLQYVDMPAPAVVCTGVDLPGLASVLESLQNGVVLDSSASLSDDGKMHYSGPAYEFGDCTSEL